MLKSGVKKDSGQVLTRVAMSMHQSLPRFINLDCQKNSHYLLTNPSRILAKFKRQNT